MFELFSLIITNVLKRTFRTNPNTDCQEVCCIIIYDELSHKNLSVRSHVIIALSTIRSLTTHPPLLIPQKLGWLLGCLHVPSHKKTYVFLATKSHRKHDLFAWDILKYSHWKQGNMLEHEHSLSLPGGSSHQKSISWLRWFPYDFYHVPMIHPMKNPDKSTNNCPRNSVFLMKYIHEITVFHEIDPWNHHYPYDSPSLNTSKLGVSRKIPAAPANSPLRRPRWRCLWKTARCSEAGALGAGRAKRSWKWFGKFIAWTLNLCNCKRATRQKTCWLKHI